MQEFRTSFPGPLRLKRKERLINRLGALFVHLKLKALVFLKPEINA